MSSAPARTVPLSSTISPDRTESRENIYQKPKKEQILAKAKIWPWVENV